MLRSHIRRVSWRERQREVFQRDGGCLLCFPHPAPDLSAHHLIPRALCRDHDPRNLITLCRRHHDLIEELDRLSDDLDWLRLYFRRYNQ